MIKKGIDNLIIYNAKTIEIHIYIYIYIYIAKQERIKPKSSDNHNTDKKST